MGLKRIGVVAIVVAAAAAWTPNASATVRGLHYVVRTDPAGNGAQTQVVASCPLGEKVLDGGTGSNFAYSEGAINATTPWDGPDANTAPDDAWASFVDNFTSSPRYGKTFAICADHRFVTGSRLKYVFDTAKISGNTSGSAGVSCPVGKRVLGGGIFNNGPYNQADVSDSRPTDGNDADSKKNDAWVAFVDNYGLQPSVDLTAYAICVNTAYVHAHLVRKTRSAFITPATLGYAKRICPVGSKLVGGGVGSDAGYNEGALAITRPFDNADKGAAPDDGWIAYANNFTFQGRNLKLTSYAICAS
jgi:hypothetical protein